MNTKLKHTVFAVSLIGVLLTTFSACSTHHDRFHDNSGLTREQFREERYRQTGHPRYHQSWEELPSDYRGRGGYSGRFGDRDPYYGSILRW
jgi:hypothetical protein